MLARWGSYHGNSISVLDVGGLKARREYYTDLMVGHYHVSPCLTYRKEEGMTDEQYEDVLIKEIEIEFETYNMSLNKTKCELIASGSYTPNVHFMNGQKLKQIVDAKYLGGNISSISDSSK